MTDQIVIALILTLASALALNWGYVREHEAANALPPVSIRRPVHTARLLLGSPRWLVGFAAEMIGWILFVVALALAPLALVQAVSASGLGILAALVSRFSIARLHPRERLGVGLSIVGLVMLGVSLGGGAGAGSEASWASLGLWFGGSSVAVAASIGPGRSLLGASGAFGVATGIAFAAGDIATKATVAGDLVLVPAMIAGYGAGTMLLQMGFQRGGALVTAGLATLLTNAIPIAAGMTIFHEPLPDGVFGALRVLAFAMVVISGVFLARNTVEERPARDRHPNRRNPSHSRPPVQPKRYGAREHEPDQPAVAHAANTSDGLGPQTRTCSLSYRPTAGLAQRARGTA
jgi:hypothetical protein